MLHLDPASSLLQPHCYSETLKTGEMMLKIQLCHLRNKWHFTLYYN